MAKNRIRALVCVRVHKTYSDFNLCFKIGECGWELRQNIITYMDVKQSIVHRSGEFVFRKNNAKRWLTVLNIKAELATTICLSNYEYSLFRVISKYQFIQHGQINKMQ